MNTKLIIHIVISLISLSGLIVYYYAFLLGYKKHNSQLKNNQSFRKVIFYEHIQHSYGMYYPLYARVQHPMIMRGYIRTFFFGVINRWNLHLHFIPYICIYRSLYDKNTG